MKTSVLLREVVREYVRSQRRTADCGDNASTVECHILTELLRAESFTQQELADRLMLDKGWISRGVDRLAADGLVTRMPDPADRRRVRLRLAPAGQARAAALDVRLDLHADSLLQGIAPDQDGQLAELLAQVLANLRQPLRQPPGCALAYRRAQPADWPAIETLLRDAGLPVDDAAAHVRHFMVGTDRTGIAAAGGFEACGADALLRSFVVAERVRGRGHGGALLGHVLAYGREAGFGTVYLLTLTAEPFFARHGFRPADRGAAPPAIRATPEFTTLCPASARLMVRSLSSPEQTP